MTAVILRKIGKCSLEQQSDVRKVRNKYSVRKSMYTEHEIALDEHLAWVQRLDSDSRQVVFVVFVNDKVSGVVSVNAIDRLHKKSDWAFYLDENVRGGLGAALEFNILDFVFSELMLEKLNCEVIETNKAVVKMHKKFGFSEEGFRRSNVEKNGVRIGVFSLGITKKEWTEKKEEIHDKYKSILSRFDLSIEYQYD